MAEVHIDVNFKDLDEQEEIENLANKFALNMIGDKIDRILFERQSDNVRYSLVTHDMDNFYLELDNMNF